MYIVLNHVDANTLMLRRRHCTFLYKEAMTMQIIDISVGYLTGGALPCVGLYGGQHLSVKEETLHIPI